MAGPRRGAGLLWGLGGAALGVCLAGVAGQLVEVRWAGADGFGVAVTVQAEPGGAFLTGSWFFFFFCPRRPDLMGRQSIPSASRMQGDSAPVLVSLL